MSKKISDKKNILVVEDELPLQEAIRLKLTSSGFEVVTARSVEQAMNYLQDNVDISVIWLDHYLIGQETGLDFVAKVKNSEKWKKIPLFLVSNTASADKIKTYLSLGINKYFTKSNHRLDDIIVDIKAALAE